MASRRSFAVLALIAANAATPQADAARFAAPSGQPVEYADDGHARVSFVDGRLLRKGPFDDEDSVVRLNELVREEDQLIAGPGAFAELEISGGTFIRLGGSTILAVEQLSPEVRVNLVRGSAYLSRGPDAAPASLAAADSRLAADTSSVVRVEHDPQAKQVSIHVQSGRGEVLAAGTSVILQAGQAIDLTPEAQEPHEQAIPDDALARWNDEREAFVRGTTRSEHVSGTQVGLHDLEPHGHWVYVSSGWAWHPRVASDWRPYRDGDWAWVEPYGWTWIPASRWGYVTHHYGRWQWAGGHGWVWVPGPAWAPAWVVWARFGVYFGWAPVDPFGRPVIIFTNVSYYDYRTWCFARRNYFYGRHGRWGHSHDRHRDRARGKGRKTPRIFTLAGREFRSLDPEPLTRAGPVLDQKGRAAARGGSPEATDASLGSASRVGKRSVFDSRRARTLRSGDASHGIVRSPRADTRRPVPSGSADRGRLRSEPRELRSQPRRSPRPSPTLRSQPRHPRQVMKVRRTGAAPRPRVVRSDRRESANPPESRSYHKPKATGRPTDTRSRVRQIGPTYGQSKPQRAAKRGAAPTPKAGRGTRIQRRPSPAGENRRFAPSQSQARRRSPK